MEYSTEWIALTTAPAYNILLNFSDGRDEARDSAPTLSPRTLVVRMINTHPGLKAFRKQETTLTFVVEDGAALPPFITQI